MDAASRSRKTFGRGEAGRRPKEKRSGQGARRGGDFWEGRKELKIQDWLYGRGVWEGKRRGGRVRSLAWVLPCPPRTAGDLGRPDAPSGTVSVLGAHAHTHSLFPPSRPLPSFSTERLLTLFLSPNTRAHTHNTFSLALGFFLPRSSPRTHLLRRALGAPLGRAPLVLLARTVAAGGGNVLRGERPRPAPPTSHRGAPGAQDQPLRRRGRWRPWWERSSTAVPAEAMPRPGRPFGARLRLLLLLPLLLLPGSYAGNLTVAVVLPLANTSYPWSWARVGPAVELALAKVKARRDLLPGWTVRTVLGSSESALGVCSDTAAPLTAVDLKWEHNPAVFLGPGCVYAAAPVGRFTAHWRVPLLTAGAPALGFGAKDEYALTTRAGPSHAKLGDFVAALHRRLGWERQALVLYAYQPGDDQPCFFVVEGLYMRVRDRLNITVDHLEFAEGDRDHYTLLLRTVRRKGRGERRPHRSRRFAPTPHRASLGTSSLFSPPDFSFSRPLIPASAFSALSTSESLFPSFSIPIPAPYPCSPLFSPRLSPPSFPPIPPELMREREIERRKERK